MGRFHSSTTHWEMSQAIKSFARPAGPTHKALSKAQRAYLERVIRVDQAGELGANLIYMGQYAALSHHKELKPVLKHMWDQEIVHHDTFNEMQTEHRVRPSILTPIWKFGAFGMGFATGLMNKEAAMACTEAVETVIGAHYNQQLRVLSNNFQDIEKLNTDTDDSSNHALGSVELNHIKDTIKMFRDQELEHLDTAIEHDSKNARPYWLLTEGIKTVCKTAVYVAERV